VNQWNDLIAADDEVPRKHESKLCAAEHLVLEYVTGPACYRVLDGEVVPEVEATVEGLAVEVEGLALLSLEKRLDNCDDLFVGQIVEAIVGR
jgi:hypothetical protein